MKIVSYILLIIGALVSGGPVGCDVCDPESEPPKKPIFYGVVRDAITGDPIPGGQVRLKCDPVFGHYALEFGLESGPCAATSSYCQGHRGQGDGVEQTGLNVLRPTPWQWDRAFGGHD